MGFTLVLAVLLVGGAVFAVVAQRRHHSRTLSGLDAEVEANRWLVRLGGGLLPSDVRAWAAADEDAARALTEAAECHREAGERLAAARTAADYDGVTRTAREGLRHLGVARSALATAPAAAPPEPSALGGARARNPRQAPGAAASATPG
ncbi:hypothetical protein ABZT03_01415 [Streptomyces sp. NPDC005574]|uniref:hypothetical protein n=1 Tax=Streptomyces sp. NPDC005574 TaxID=3156891 RepID=UPI0033AAFBA5